MRSSDFVKDDTLMVTNSADVSIFVRVYTESDGFLGRKSYSPLSDVVEVRRGEKVQISLSGTRGVKKLFYKHASNKDKAHAIFTDTGPTFTDTFVYIKNQEAEDLISIQINDINKQHANALNVNYTALKTNYSTYKNDSAHMTELKTKGEGVRTRVEKSVNKATLKDPAAVVISKDKTGDVPLSDSEKEFIAERDKVVKQEFDILLTEALGELAKDVDHSRYLPRVGVCGSGGGFRAMVGFHGFNVGMMESGTYDMVHYRSGTSGSTWAIADLSVTADLSECNDEYKGYMRSFPERLQAFLTLGIHDEIVFSDIEQVYLKALKESCIKDDEFDLDKYLEVIDQYKHISDTALLKWTGRLSNAVLSSTQQINAIKNKEKTHVHEKPIRDTRKRNYSKYKDNPQMEPLNIFNMIAFTEGSQLITDQKSGEAHIQVSYRSHIELTSRDVAYVPDTKDRGKYFAWRLKTENFGARCDDPSQFIGEASLDGVAEVRATSGKLVPLSVSSLIATCGSAMTPGWRTIYENLPGYVQEGLKLAGYAPGQSSAKDGVITESIDDGYLRGYAVSQAVPGRGGNTMVLRDAGFDYNLPMFPLLRSGRDCQVMVVYDTDGNLSSEPGRQLYKALQDAKSLGRNINPIWASLSEKEFIKAIQSKIKNGLFPIVLGDPDNPDELSIIYAPAIRQACKLFKGDALRDGHFSPEKVSTIQLNYSEKELKELHEFGRELGCVVSDKIKEVLLRKYISNNKLMSKIVSSSESLAKLISHPAVSVGWMQELICQIDYKDIGSIGQIMQAQADHGYVNHHFKNKLSILRAVSEARELLGALVNDVLKNDESPLLLVDHILLLNRIVVMPFGKRLRDRVVADAFNQSSNKDPSSKAFKTLQRYLSGDSGFLDRRNPAKVASGLMRGEDKDYNLLLLILMIQGSHQKSPLSFVRQSMLEMHSNNYTAVLKKIIADKENPYSREAGLVDFVQKVLMADSKLKSALRIVKEPIGDRGQLLSLVKAYDDIVVFAQVNIDEAFRSKLVKEVIGDFTHLKKPMTGAEIVTAFRARGEQNHVDLLLSLQYLVTADSGKSRDQLVNMFKSIISSSNDNATLFACYTRLADLYRRSEMHLERYDALMSARTINPKDEYVSRQIEDVLLNISDLLKRNCKSMKASVDDVRSCFEILRQHSCIPKSIITDVASAVSVDKMKFLLDNLSREHATRCSYNIGYGGWNAVHFAAHSNRVDLLELFDSYGLSEMFEVVTGKGFYDGSQTPIILAAKNKSRASLEYCCSRSDVKLLNSTDQNGYSALSHAYNNKDLVSFEVLLKNGASPDVLYHNKSAGNTLLHLACSESRPDFVKLLLDAGADMDKVNENGKTPFEISEQKSQSVKRSIVNPMRWISGAEIKPTEDQVKVVELMNSKRQENKQSPRK